MNEASMIVPEASDKSAGHNDFATRDGSASFECPKPSVPDESQTSRARARNLSTRDLCASRGCARQPQRPKLK